MSRRGFMKTAATVGALVGAGLPTLAAARGGASKELAEGCDPAPVPIPGGINIHELFPPGNPFPDRVFHLFLPFPDLEPSTIFHFKGDVAVACVKGTGTRRELDPNTGAVIGETPYLPWVVDLRFMQGQYIGADGRRYRGTFGFY